MDAACRLLRFSKELYTGSDQRSQTSSKNSAATWQAQWIQRVHPGMRQLLNYAILLCQKLILRTDRNMTKYHCKVYRVVTYDIGVI